MARKKTDEKAVEVENEILGSPARTETQADINPATAEVKEVNTSDDDYNVEVIKDYYGRVDVYHLSKKDPNYEYRFLRDEAKNLSIKTGNMLFQSGGWQICSRDHLLKIGVAERFISPDGVYRVGENILARMPKKLYAEKEAEKVKRANAPMNALQRKLKHGDKSAEHSTSLHPTLRGIETAEALGMGRNS